MCQLDYPRTHDSQMAVPIHIIAVNATTASSDRYRYVVAGDSQFASGIIVDDCDILEL